MEFRGAWNRGILFGCLLGAATGCAGRSLNKLDTSDLPKDVAKDLVDKFEVKEASDAAAAADPAGTKPAPGDKPKATAANPGASDPAPPVPPTASPDKPVSGKGKRGKGKKAREDAKAQAQASDDADLAPKAPFAWPNRRPAKEPIWVGEKHTFEITYFGMAAGDLDLEVMPHKALNSRKVYHVKGHAVSSKVFSFFYQLDDTVETFFDYDGIFSHRFQLKLDETKQTRATLELNDSEKKQTFYWNKWNHYKKGYIETKEFQPIQPFSQDSLSALFYVRTVPLPDGKEITFPVVSEGKSWEAVVTVVRREECSIPGGKTMCVVLKPEMKYQGILQKKGDSFLWLTDDDRRFVVRLEAKVRIGTVVARLKKIERGTPPEP